MKTPHRTLYALLLLPMLAQAGEPPADAAKAAGQGAAPDLTGQRADGGIFPPVPYRETAAGQVPRDGDPHASVGPIPPIPARETVPGQAPHAAGGGMPPQPLGDVPLGAPATEQLGQ